jgi:hypothetical protein
MEDKRLPGLYYCVKLQEKDTRNKTDKLGPTWTRNEPEGPTRDSWKDHTFSGVRIC